MHNIRNVSGLVCLALIVGPASAVTRYVSTVGSDFSGTGSQASPYATIQRAINESAPSGDVVELADGTYTGFGNVGVNYVGKSVIVRSTSGTPQACVIDGLGTTVGFQFVSGELAGAVLEGVTVQNCVQQGPLDGEGRGGAIVIENASPTIRNCIFSGNKAIGGDAFFAFFPVNGLGGAVYSFNAGSTFTNCTFSGNQAIGGNSPFVPGFAGIGGGGAVAGQYSNLRFVGCAFGSNVTIGGMDGYVPPVARGGGVYIENGSAIFQDCMFTQNTTGSGGGSFVYNGTTEAVNSIFVMNTASENGGAIATDTGSISVTNCSIANNSATQSGGAFFVAGGFGPNTVDNSVVWGNSATLAGAGFFNAGSPNTVFSFSVLQGSGGSASWSVSGATDGGSNLDADPGFLRTPGTLNVSDLGDLRLSSTSICIDSGSNAKVPIGIVEDLDGEGRIFNDVVDRGAYEFHVSPAQLINDLKASIDALVAGGATLPAQGRGLKATLNVALAAVSRGYDDVAVLALRAFQLQCAALRLARRLTAAQYTAFYDDAQEIIEILN